MRDDYRCVICKRPAQEVHHIEHLSEQNIWKPDITMSDKNLACLCRACHMKIHEQDKLNGRRKKPESDHGDEYEFDKNGFLVRKADKDIPPS